MCDHFRTLYIKGLKITRKVEACYPIFTNWVTQSVKGGIKLCK